MLTKKQLHCLTFIDAEIRRSSRGLKVLRLPMDVAAAASDFSELPRTADGLRAELRALEILVDRRIEALDLIEAAEQALNDAANDPEAEPDPREPWQVPARSDFLHPII